MLTMACSRHMVSECFPLLANPEYPRAYRIRALKLPVVDLAGKPWRLCVLPRSRAISSLNMPLTTRTISETISAEAQYWPTRHHSPRKPCFRALIDPSSIKYAKAMTHHLASHGAQIWGYIVDQGSDSCGASHRGDEVHTSLVPSLLFDLLGDYFWCDVRASAY